jgi:hypothetical protein
MFIALTEAMAELTGKPAEAAVSRILTEMLPGLPAELREICQTIVEHGSTKATREGAPLH